ncbi:MAG: tRNA guanosine(34) transglycosylase Tgt [Deltaproteobacteria bacterium]|nr:MAG: tRNA guanosine(34) transglycosylase Tgt [Deltaproteobacteria bacterium]
MATRCCSFDLLSELGQARAGVLHLPHGDVPTPAFMPVGTRGSVRGVGPDQLQAVGAEMLLANTYHLWARPGPQTIANLGGIHRFMAWDRPVLTDSGGYQVFSLGARVKLTEEGVSFRDPEDGAKRFLTPELAIQLQETFGVDVAMQLDECLDAGADRERAAWSTARTTRWLERGLAARERPDRTAVFGIVQGGMFEDLRREHALELSALDLDGYAIGGLSVGEGTERMRDMAAVAAGALPRSKVRYLMGVGLPIDLVESVMLGVDLFDCVVPTRAGRHGTAFTSVGRLNLSGARFAEDRDPIDPACPCPSCRTFSRGYLRHLFKSKELLARSAVSVHNLAYLLRLLRRVRRAVIDDDLAALRALHSEARVASTSQPG